MNPSLLRSRFRIKTPPIMEALEDVRSLIEFRDTGGFMVAPQRWGKTSAAKYICLAITALFGHIPTIFVPMRSPIKAGGNSFFKFILTQARHKYANRAGRTETDLRNLTTECIVTRARRSKHKMLILVIDEAQLLTLEQWGFLFNISNEVDAHDLSLLVLSIGQSRLLKAAEGLLNDNREEISERFLQRRIRFRGLQTEAELKFVLQQLAKVEMPPGSGTLLLSRYLPKAMEGRWSIDQESGKLWTEFVAVYGDLGLKTVELPMTYVFNAINRFLLMASRADAVSLSLPDDFHRKCVRESGVSASINSALRREKKAREKAAQGKEA